MTTTTKFDAHYERWLHDTAGLSLAEIRCDSPPSDTVLQLLDNYGLEAWERFASQFFAEFASFQRSGRDCDDLGAVLRDEGLAGCGGRIYCKDCLYIEDASEWPKNAERGQWYTLIGRSEYQSDDLAAIERRLFEFARTEGYDI